MTALASALLTAAHLRRKACVYVRQSSDFQVRHHVERQRLQFALADHARQLGFRDVEVIDEDQGTSGDGVLRTGFDRLVSAVCRGAVGLVLSLEASRLARNGRDWHTLLDFCAIVGCLVGDRRCLYDPAVADDRLFLGMKGNFAEAELALFRQRSWESRLALAQRGELFTHVPAGHEKAGKRRIEMTPDQRQRDALRLVFRQFAELRSVRQVWLWLRREQVEIPVRQLGRGIVWKVPTETGLNALFHNPIYAGAYAYGRRRQETWIENGRKRVRGGILKSGPEEWTVLLRDRHEAYITWEEYERCLLADAFSFVPSTLTVPSFSSFSSFASSSTCRKHAATAVKFSRRNLAIVSRSGCRLADTKRTPRSRQVARSMRREEKMPIA